MKTTLRNLTVAWPLVIFLPLPALTHAETAVQVWLQRYDGAGNGDDRPSGMAVDASDSVIVVGPSRGSGTGDNYTAIKYSSAGAPLWTNRYGWPGNGDDSPTAVAVDRSNNVIVTGYSATTNLYPYYYEYATIKYSSAGVPLWTNRYHGPGSGSDHADALAVDNGDNVIVTGSSSRPGGGSDYATIKYSGTGVPLWTNRYSGSARAVAVDGSNDVIVTGASWSATSADYATIKYSSAGVPLWTNRYDGPASDWDGATAVTVDGSNNVIVTGDAWGIGSFWDYTTIEYSSAGVPLWTNCYNGPGGTYDSPYAVAVDGNNNVIVTGGSDGGGSSADYATIKISSAGVPLWTNCYNGPANSYDRATAVAVDARNEVVVTGFSPTGGGFSDYATIKYSSAGLPLWTNLAAGPGNSDDQASGVAVDHNGNVIVTGSFYGYRGNADFVTVKYAFPLVVTQFKLINGAFQMLLDNVQPGTLVIEASTSLAGWSPIFTNPTPTNMLFYTDPDAGNYPGRFYRASQSP